MISWENGQAAELFGDVWESVGNPAEHAKQYEILVDRKNLEQARFAIQK